jgi:uncharacterized protein YndB with AHSA1/START domain
MLSITLFLTKFPNRKVSPMNSIERTVWINEPIEKVWQAITQPKHLEKWYAPGCAWEIPTLQVGTTIKFYNTPTDVQLATIEVVEPPHQFRLRWHTDNPDVVLTNTYSLSEENGGTRVNITQTGYESLPANERQMWFDADDGAYTAIIENLKNYVEQELVED